MTDDLVVLRTFPYEFEALIAQQDLEAGDVASVIATDTWSPVARREFRLTVHHADVERARPVSRTRGAHGLRRRRTFQAGRLTLSTPDLHLHTLFVLNDAGRITSSREPAARRGPLFFLVRSATRCSWAIRADVPDALAAELDGLAGEEPPAAALGDAPVHADRYLSILKDRPWPAGRSGSEIRQSSGPAFSFPPATEKSADVVFVEDESLLAHNFRGWVPGEIAAGGGPVAAIVIDGHPVSICFSARASHAAAEAGVETAERFRGRGLAARVTAAWALAIRTSGRIPLYSTSWTNHASLAVARKLGLIAYASSWSVSD